MRKLFSALSLISRHTVPYKNPIGALIVDALTQEGLGRECTTVNITPWNHRKIFTRYRPHLLFVESAWQGHRNRWKYKIAAYPDYPSRNNLTLARVVDYARDLGIPTVFWNKEDSVHFDRFIDSARLFDHIFTVDANCVDRYRAILGPQASVHVLPFAVQPAIHSFTGFAFRRHRANFVGSYSHHIHDRRRQWQDMLFHAASGLGFK